MMVFTTLFIAAIVIAALYFLIVRTTPWPLLGYGVMVLVGVACFFLGSVHFAYIGIEIAGLGSFIVWMHHRFWRKVPESQRAA